MLDWQVLTDPADLEALAPEWDQLAVENGLPMMAPACVLAWRRHLAPALAEFRAITVFEGSQLAGLAPFYRDGRRPGTGMRSRAMAKCASRRWKPASPARFGSA